MMSYKNAGMVSFHIFIGVILLLPTLSGTAHAENRSAEKGLVLAVHPYLPPQTLIKKFSPIANYLSARIGKPVTVRIGSSYEEHIQYIGQNKVDIAYMGPASFVTMEDRFGNKPVLAKLAMKDGRSWFQGNIITRKDSKIKTLADLQGKRIAFGDPASTMSYIVPHYMLHQAGVFTDSSAGHQFLHSHNNVALGVLSGDFDAGAVKPAVFRKFEAKGLRTIVMTPKISEHLFVARADCPDELVVELRQAMLDMNKSEAGITALHSIKKTITGLVEADSSNYENLRNIIIEARELH